MGLRYSAYALNLSFRWASGESVDPGSPFLFVRLVARK